MSDNSAFTFLPLRVHAVGDYVVDVIAFVVPLLADFPTTARNTAWIVAVLHLVLNMFTDYPTGVFKRVSLANHLNAELVQGPVIVALPWLLGFSDSGAAVALFVVMGTGSFISSLVTDRTAWHSNQVRLHA